MDESLLEYADCKGLSLRIDRERVDGGRRRAAVPVPDVGPAAPTPCSDVSDKSVFLPACRSGENFPAGKNATRPPSCMR